jgi:integrase
MLEEDNVRKGFLEHDAYRRLRDELPPESRLLLVVAYHVGGRKGELMHIEWPDVDLRAKRITLPVGTTKNKEGRTLPIYGEMFEWLRMARTVRDAQHPNCDSVFERKGKAIKDFRKAWASACKRAGLDGLLFHDLRRTAVRNMVRAGIPEKVAMQISGHKTRSVFDRYNIVSDRDLSDAAAKMERHLESLGTIPGTTSKSEEKPHAKNAAKLFN